MTEEKLTLRYPNEIAVRMYGQGFGDCFLLAFPRTNADGGDANPADPVYVVIDSGVFFGTPDQKKRMRAVAGSIRKATGGVVDLLIATHEHYDHLCGFEEARSEWKKIVVKRIWLPWTEDSNHPATRRYDREQETLARQVANAWQNLGAWQKDEPVLAAELRRASTLAMFGGGIVPEDDLEDDVSETDETEDFGADDGSAAPFPAPRRVSKTPNLILSDFAKDPGKRFKPGATPTERDFCEPGQVRPVPGTEVDAYVLGPPTDETLLGLDFLESEVYSEDSHGVAAPAWERLAVVAASNRAERDSLGSALEQHARQGDSNDADLSLDSNAPFRPSLSISYPEAREDAFFQQYYFAAEQSRQIEADWLYGVGRLALQLDSLTNNTSLVLAFRLPDPDGRVLLFVGDAQVGNWLSWQQIEPQDWHRPDGGDVTYRPSAADLLAQTVVYKVGHHGSHNATLKNRGLEMMPDNLIAFVPASRKIPQFNYNPPWSIPLDSLMDRLKTKSKGQIILPHDDDDLTNPTFAAQVERSKDNLPPMKRKDKDGNEETVEDAVPLWRQIRI